jgi:hypothetical protein
MMKCVDLCLLEEVTKIEVVVQVASYRAHMKAKEDIHVLY